MAEKTKRSSDGLIVSWALLVIAICIVGSIISGAGPVRFLFIGTAVTLAVVIASFFTLGVIAFLTQTFVNAHHQENQQDKKTFTQLLFDKENRKEITAILTKILGEIKRDLSEDWQAGPSNVIEKKFFRSFLSVFGRSEKQS